MTKRATGAAEAPAPRKSGANIPEAQRSTVQLKLRVPAATVEQLDALCNGEPRSEFVAALIGAARKKARWKLAT